jgi:hypothetical protein
MGVHFDVSAHVTTAQKSEPSSHDQQNFNRRGSAKRLPYFAVVKPTIAMGFDFHEFDWTRDPPPPAPDLSE